MRKDYPVNHLCRNLGLARSSFYHKRQAKQPDADRALYAAIRQLAYKYPTYGSRRIAAQLRLAPHGIKVGRHRVRELMAEMGLRQRTKRRSTTNSQHGRRIFPNLVKGITATRPGHIWVADITYIELPADTAYLAIIMDVFTRMICGWRLSDRSGQSLTQDALNKALRAYPAPQIHHSDRGGQYAAKVYVQQLQAAGTQISMAARGKPSENGYAERVIRTIKEEEVLRSDYQSLEEAQQQIGHFIDEVYAHERIHSALAYSTPAEYEAQWSQTTPLSSDLLCPVS